MKKIERTVEISIYACRTFTYRQLSKIIDDNNGVLRRRIDLSPFKAVDVFIMYAPMDRYRINGEPSEPYLTALVSPLDSPLELGAQDLTIKQWEEGKEYNDNDS